MLTIEDLSCILQRQNPYICFALLESGAVCYQEAEDKIIPPVLMEDLGDIYGQEAAEDAVKCLVGLKALIRTEKGLLINAAEASLISAWLNQLKRDLKLIIHENEERIEEFIFKLISYLKEHTSCLIVSEALDNSDFILSWEGKKYWFQLAFSPVWLPAVAEMAAGQNTYVVLIGPFAAQNWQQMIKYYAHPAFRNYTAYFDPWHQQKMNISRCGLLTYFDWFFRDVYGLKFFIPQLFSLSLQDMGLLRYNDER